MLVSCLAQTGRAQANDIALQDEVPVSGISGTAGGWRFYYIDVPSGQTSLRVTTAGGSGDVDLFVNPGSRPGTNAGGYQCQVQSSSSAEECVFANPVAGRYYVGVLGFTAYSGVTLLADYQGAAPPTDIALQDEVPVSGISGTAGGWRFYYIDVPSGQTSLRVTTAGGSGDVDLFVNPGSRPGTNAGGYQCQVQSSSSAEECVFANPVAGRYYVGVLGFTAYSGVTLLADYQGAAPPTDIALQDEVPVSGISGTAGGWRFYYIDVPSGQTSLRVTTAGGSGDVDLFVNPGSRPGTNAGGYQCQVQSSSSAEECVFANPVAGRYYVGVLGFTAYSGVTLLADYQGAAPPTGQITASLGQAVNVGVNTQFTVPVQVVFANSSPDLASLTIRIDWPSGLTYQSFAPGPVGSSVINASSGTLTIGWFNPSGTRTAFSLGDLTFRTGASLGQKILDGSIVAAGNEAGQSIISHLQFADLAVTVGTFGRWGDSNDDNQVDILDAQQIARATVGLSTLKPACVSARGDVNADGAVNILDAQQVARHAVGLPTPGRAGTPGAGGC